MPQLETMYIFMFFLWTWLMLYLLMKKVELLPMIKTPKHQPHKTNKKPNMDMPWT